MLMRPVVAGGVCAALLASCATVPPSGPPPVRDGGLPRASEAAPEPPRGGIERRMTVAEPAPAPPAVPAPRTPEPGSPARERTELGLPESEPAPLGEEGPETASALRPFEPAPTQAAPRDGNPAVVALLESAREAVEARQHGRAAAALERAVKVDPRDPRVWHRLAAVRHWQGRHAEAEALALRSLSLRPSDRALVSRNWRVIAAARLAQGDGEGAREARARAGSR